MAGEKAAYNFLLEVYRSGAFELVGGLQSKDFSQGATPIDVTNHGTNQNRTLLDGAGVYSAKVSGKGVANGDASLHYIEDQMKSQALTQFRLRDTATGGRTYTAYWKIVDFKQGGAHDKELGYDISLESSGAVTVS